MQNAFNLFKKNIYYKYKKKHSLIWHKLNL